METGGVGTARALSRTSPMNDTSKFGPRISYDQIANVYDVDMGRNLAYDDVRYYVERALEQPDSVLELGCGTGRITMPLLRAGLAVTGVDVSSRMLSVFRRKLESAPYSERARLQLLQMDIRSWALRRNFSTILCPYSLLTYLVELSAQQSFLDQAGQHLCKDGQLILDAFIPDSTIQYRERIWDYRRPLGNGRFLERSRTIEPTDRPQINAIRRTYSIVAESGERIRTFTTAEHIHCFYPDQLRSLVEQSGFEVVCTDWDYGSETAESTARFVTLRCRLH
jgi:SAM-dependent methyltransferase